MNLKDDIRRATTVPAKAVSRYILRPFLFVDSSDGIHSKIKVGSWPAAVGTESLLTTLSTCLGNALYLKFFNNSSDSLKLFPSNQKQLILPEESYQTTLGIN